jgi:riboflavin biosynthesis pyrimidine reductase
MGAETMQHKDGMDIAIKDARESETLDENGQPNQPAPIVLDTQRKLGRVQRRVTKGNRRSRRHLNGHDEVSLVTRPNLSA